jgi:chromosome segregation ATPase
VTGIINYPLSLTLSTKVERIDNSLAEQKIDLQDNKTNSDSLAKDIESLRTKNERLATSIESLNVNIIGISDKAELLYTDLDSLKSRINEYVATKRNYSGDLNMKADGFWSQTSRF